MEMCITSNHWLDSGVLPFPLLPQELTLSRHVDDRLHDLKAEPQLEPGLEEGGRLPLLFQCPGVDQNPHLL